MLLLSAEWSSPDLSLAQTEGKTHEQNVPGFSGFDEEELSIIDTEITMQCLLYAHHHFLWPKEIGVFFSNLFNSKFL